MTNKDTEQARSWLLAQLSDDYEQDQEPDEYERFLDKFRTGWDLQDGILRLRFDVCAFLIPLRDVNEDGFNLYFVRDGFNVTGTYTTPHYNSMLREKLYQILANINDFLAVSQEMARIRAADTAKRD